MDHPYPIIDAYLDLRPSHRINSKVFGCVCQSFSGGTKTMGWTLFPGPAIHP